MKRVHPEVSIEASQNTNGCDRCTERQNMKAVPELKKRRMVIEKKRRDRINKYLEELSQLVPAAAEKAEASKIEKAEILELTVEYVKSLVQGIEENEFKEDRYDKFPGLPPIKKPTFSSQRDKGFWNCASQIQEFLARNYIGEEKQIFLPALRRHLSEYATTKLPRITSIKSPFASNASSGPNPFENMDEKFQMVFRKICMDFLKNNGVNDTSMAESTVYPQEEQSIIIPDANSIPQTIQYDLLFPATQSYQVFPINEFTP